MPQDLIQFALTAFVTLIVVVDPISVTPIFVAMTRGMERAERRAVISQAVAIAFSVALFFMLAGGFLLSFLGVSVDAFAISGGILLFVTALPMLFGERPGLQGPEPGEHSTVGENIAVFPLAIPLLTGPGAIASILLLTIRAGANLSYLISLALAITVVYLITLVAMSVGDRLLSRLGEGKIHIVSRVLGIILAALAVQFVLNGITGFYKSLVSP